MQTNQLINYNAARFALQQAASVDEVKTIKDKAEAIRLYAQQQRDDDLEKWAAAIKTRAMRRLGELSSELETATNQYALPSDGKSKSEVLEEAGISTSTAHRAEKLAEIPQDVFEEAVERGETATQILKSINIHVANNSGENEWYTPSKFIEAARSTMGSITLDPASCALANETVKAGLFFDKNDDGLTRKWMGNIWLNPPYAQPLIGHFAKKLVLERENYYQAIVLVNNATETEWFSDIVSIADAICFPRSRIKFIDKDGNASGAPLQGQAILYIGSNIKEFYDNFSEFGWCAEVRHT